MKFGSKFEQSKIPEWADFYVSYMLLRKLLAPFRALQKVYVRSTTTDTKTAIHNFSTQEIEKLEHFSKIFESIIFEDLEKVLVFYTQQLSSTIAKWKSIRLNMMIYKEKRDTLDKQTQTQNYEMLKVRSFIDHIDNNLFQKQAFHILLRELKLLTEYITVNLEAFQKIIRKHSTVVKDFAPNDTLKSRLEKYLLESKIFLMRDRLNNFLVSVENEYIRSFFKNKIEGVNAIRQFTQNVLMSKNETFWFGLFTGFAVLLVILIVVLCVDGGLDIDGNQVLKEVFPIFRGIGLIILYMGFLAWNVYGWTKYHVNYRLIFRFNYHYSQIGQILRRAAIFATILLILLLWYLLVDSQTSKLGKVLDFIPKGIIPLFLWVSFIIYMFFPNFKVFNGPGRRYVYNIIKLILKSVLFVPVKFAVIWSTDQLTSFTLPLKDTEYTVCYYIRYFFYDEEDIQQCQSSKRFTKSLIMAVIPVLFRILQCIRQIYDQAPNRRDPIINLGKYCFSAIVSVLSYLVTLYDSETRFLIAWIVFAAISTAYSYCWDVKKDWGFLEPNAKHKFLRNQLSYHSPSFYYTVIVANLVMRLAWTLSISPDIINKIVRPELITLFVGIIEILRRALWNFLRVEKEHLVNVGSFQAVPKIHLPYENITFQDSAQDDLFNNDLEKIMDNDKKTLVPISMKAYLPSYRRTSLVTMAETYNKISRQTSKIDLHFLSEHQNDQILRNISVIPFKATAIGAMNKEERQQLFKDLQKYREEEQLRYLKWEKEVKQFKILIKQKESQFQIVNTRSEPKIFKDLDKHSQACQNEETKPIISYQHTITPKKSLSKNQQTEAFMNNERVNKLLNQVNAEEKFIWAQEDDHSEKTTPIHSLPKLPKKNYPNVQMLHRIHTIHSNLAALHSGSTASPPHKGDSVKSNLSRPFHTPASSQNQLIEMSNQSSDFQNKKVSFITVPQHHHEQESLKLPSPIQLENMIIDFDEKAYPESPHNSNQTGSPDAI